MKIALLKNFRGNRSFFLWIALSFLSLQINLVIAGDSAAATAGLSLLVPWCVHVGADFYPLSRFWVCLGSFICKCHSLWQTTGPEDSQGAVGPQLGLPCVGVLGTMGPHFQGALIDPHYLASTELMSHWMALRNSEEPQNCSSQHQMQLKMLYVRMCLEFWVLGHFYTDRLIMKSRLHTHTHTPHSSFEVTEAALNAHLWAQPWFWNRTETEWLGKVP